MIEQQLAMFAFWRAWFDQMGYPAAQRRPEPFTGRTVVSTWTPDKKIPGFFRVERVKQ